MIVQEWMLAPEDITIFQVATAASNIRQSMSTALTADSFRERNTEAIINRINARKRRNNPNPAMNR